jgi:sec-independent protein translocase protein TatB
MMPGVGFTEMILLVLVGIVVIGPRDLPLMMRKFGRMTGKVRAMAFEFKQGFDELGRQAELEELRREVSELKKSTGLDDLQREFEQDKINLERDVQSAMAPVAAKPGLPTPAPDIPTHNPFEMAEIDTQLPGVPAPETVAEAADAPLDQPLTFADMAGDENRIGAGVKPQPVKQDTTA